METNNKTGFSVKNDEPPMEMEFIARYYALIEFLFHFSICGLFLPFLPFR